MAQARVQLVGRNFDISFDYRGCLQNICYDQAARLAADEKKAIKVINTLHAMRRCCNDTSVDQTGNYL